MSAALARRFSRSRNSRFDTTEVLATEDTEDTENFFQNAEHDGYRASGIWKVLALCPLWLETVEVGADHGDGGWRHAGDALGLAEGFWTGF